MKLQDSSHYGIRKSVSMGCPHGTSFFLTESSRALCFGSVGGTWHQLIGLFDVVIAGNTPGKDPHVWGTGHLDVPFTNQLDLTNATRQRALRQAPIQHVEHCVERFCPL